MVAVVGDGELLPVGCEVRRRSYTTEGVDVWAYGEGGGLLFVVCDEGFACCYRSFGEVSAALSCAVTRSTY